MTDDADVNQVEPTVDDGAAEVPAEDVLARLEDLEDLEDEASEDERLYLEQVASSDYPDRLRAACAALLKEPENFEVGDLVMWKPALRNRYFPAPGAPAVVLGFAPGRVSDERNPGSALFDEPLDLQLGVIEGDGDLIVFHYDRRRFTRWQGDTESE